MSEKNKDKAVEILPGTVEYARQEYFEKESAAYEERTGEKVNYVMPHPLTSTPLAGVPVDRTAMHIKALKAEAKALGIDGAAKMKKPELIAAIEAKLSEAAESETDESDESAEGELE